MAQDYRSTVHLPKTAFPMRANLPEREPALLRAWKDEKVYDRLVEAHAADPKFILHDGPPYANFGIHQGTALNKILKDLVAKYRAMTGRLVDVVPGWDCHGLPIELAVDKQLGPKKKAMSAVEFRRECRRYAEKAVHAQKESFERLGVLMRWDQPYLTMAYAYEAQTVRELAKFVERGHLYRQKKPVYWCPKDRTALAEAEIEYADHTSPSIFVAMRLVSDPARLSPALAGRDVDLVIWTTTPWTLPANLAIAAHKEFTYVAYDLSGRVIVVAKDLLASMLAECAPAELQVKDASALGVQGAVLRDPSKVLAFFQGSELEGLEYRHPFLDRVSPVLLGEHVTLEAGSGLVHTAPGHGYDDYVLGKQHGLEILAPVDDAGRFTPEVPGFEGKFVFDANREIVERLHETGHLLSDPAATITHSYPHCWRCDGPVIFRATDQWFLSLSEHDLRQKCLDAIDDVTWIPHWGKARILGMMENRPDWCVSRQRTWGVPIVAFYCESCGTCILDAGVMRHVADVFEKESADAWAAHPATELLPEGFRCPSCGGAEFRKEKDILDVWFDSGVSYANVAEMRGNQGFPVDLYLEGSDQHRGWFNSSLIAAVGTRGRAPYRAVLTHGFVVDGQGRKLSKRLGNGVPLETMLKKYGADIIRLWVAAEDYREDIRLSNEILDNLSEAYRKIRNTLRWMLGSLDGFDPARDSVTAAELLPLDKWALEMTARYVERMHEAFETYEFHLAHFATQELCAKTLSAFYFDVLKDRLYTHALKSTSRRSAQTALWRIADALTRSLAPILSFTADEAYRELPGHPQANVFLAGMPNADELRAGLAPGEGERLVEKYGRLVRAVRVPVQKELEDLKAAQQPLFKERKALEDRSKAAPLSEPEQERLRALDAETIGNSLDARVTLAASGPLAEFLAAHEAELPELLIVSQVELTKAARGDAEPDARPSTALGTSEERGGQADRADAWLKHPAAALGTSEERRGTEAAHVERSRDIERPSSATRAFENLTVQVSRARGDKCARCWCYTESRGIDPRHPELCPKCTHAVLADAGEEQGS